MTTTLQDHLETFRTSYPVTKCLVDHDRITYVFQTFYNAYKAANDIMPDQQYATDKIFELHALIKKNENLEKNYQSAVTKGTQYFADKKYELAIAEFETALTLKPGESPVTRLV